MPEWTSVSSVFGGDAATHVTRATYNRQLLTRAQPLLVHQKFGQQKPLNERQGQTMVFRRYSKLAQVTTPLTEGVTPPGVQMSKTDITCTIAQFGSWIGLTDLITVTSFDRNVNEAVKMLGENMGETIDSVIRDIVNAGTNVYFLTGHDVYQDEDAGVARTDVDGRVGPGVFYSAIRTLKNAEAKPFTPRVLGSGRVGSAPFGDSYWVIVHPNLEYDLQQMSGYIPVWEYPNQTNVMVGEIGAWKQFRFISTTNAVEELGGGGDVASSGLLSTGAKVDVYTLLILGRESYAVVPLNGLSSKTIITPAGGQGDYLKQRSAAAWKAAITGCVTNDSWMLRLECGATANPV